MTLPAKDPIVRTGVRDMLAAHTGIQHTGVQHTPPALCIGAKHWLAADATSKREGKA